MSRIEELIEKLCPDGVEYKSIKDLVGVNRGSRLTKSQLIEDGNYEVYHGSKDTILGLYNDYNAPKNTTIVVNTGGIGGVKFLDKEFWCSDGSFWLGHSSEINDKFLYYYVVRFEEYFASQKRIGGVPTIDRSVVENLQVPIPPLEVQSEIVKILDNFTELTVELTVELTARKQQYEYYRDNLLDFNQSDVKWLKLGECCKLSAGGDVPKDRFSKELIANYNIPIYSNGIGKNALYGYTDIAKITQECVTISARGTIGYSELRKEPFYPVVRLICAIPNEQLNVAFLKYYLETIKFEVPTTGIPQLTVPMVEKYRVPIPSLEKQREIVEILNNFSKICTDISEGLPAEIYERQKQYEYYRDKLLTFKEKKV